MKIFNAAVIGAGFIGSVHIQTIQRIPGVHLRAICTTNPQKKKDLEMLYPVDYVTDSWQAIIDDPDIDVIHNCTPNAMHDEINRAAILAGKHIYAEKPLSQTGTSAEAIYMLAKSKGVAHGVNFQYRMNAAVHEMRARIRNESDSKRIFVQGIYYQDSVTRHTDYTKRQIPETSPARALLDIGIHWADTAMFVMDQPIRRVYAQMYTHHPVRIDPETGKEVVIRSDDTTTVMLEFADGTPGMAAFSKCMMGHKNDLVVTVNTEAHEYTWKQEACNRLYIGNRESGNEKFFIGNKYGQKEAGLYAGLPAGHDYGWQDAQYNAMAAFYTSIENGSYRNEKQDYATMEDGWRAARFVDACLLSARENRWVELGEIR